MKKRSALAILLLLSFLFHGCEWSFSSEETTTNTSTDTNTNTEAESEPVWKTMHYSYKTEVDETLLKTNCDPAYLLLINKENPKSSLFEPANLVTLTQFAAKDGLELEEKAAAALNCMMKEMEADGACDVKVTSAYRDYAYQDYLYQKYVSEEMTALGLTESEAEKIVDTYSARPGYSEHQSGLCVDFIRNQSVTLDRSFANAKAFAWLSENAYRFGFILRYPEGKEEITGYSYEPWHYRFVGREAATEIYCRNITLEEYENEVG